MKHLLKLSDLTAEEIIDILNLADQLKYEKKNGIENKPLKGKSLGMIFRKASTRTRVSFEIGMYELGGHALFLNANDLQIGRGEEVRDTAKVLSRYLDGVMIRTYAQGEVEQFAQYSSIPVINGLTDYSHPCQVLADLMTIREYKGSFKGQKLCFASDGNNMANSLIVGCIKVGMRVSIACPKGYEPDAEIMKWAYGTGMFELTGSVTEAARDADVLYTDVWASMGQEDEAEIRRKAFKGYQVNAEVMSVAKNDAIVLHCLPAHKGEEITEEVFEAHANEIFDEAENRLHAQKAVLVKLLGQSKQDV
jgi:ornithine carbamoyltransferase